MNRYRESKLPEVKLLAIFKYVISKYEFLHMVLKGNIEGHRRKGRMRTSTNIFRPSIIWAFQLYIYNQDTGTM